MEMNAASVTRIVSGSAHGSLHGPLSAYYWLVRWVAVEQVMAGGWARDGAVQDQIDASVEDAVQRARSRLPQGESARRCEECDQVIPEARRQAIPGVRLCVSCQSELDEKQTSFSGYNRRGSKDSQLR